MANNSLSLPDLLGEPRSETDYQAVHAELMATKHGRDFLAEYARRNLDPETRKFVSTMARLESAMRDHQVPQISATMLQGLGDLARAIEQSEAVFLAAGDSAANDFLAVQRIQDIGMALRRRDVEPALCDALDEAAREIGDAMVRGNAAMVGKLSSASLLRDLRERVNDLIAFCKSATSPGTNEHDGDDSQHETATFDERKSRDDAGPLFAIATEKTANDESRGAIDAMRFDNTRNESPTDSHGVDVCGTGCVSPQPDGVSPPWPVPDAEAQARPEQGSSAGFEPQRDAVPQITAKPEQPVGAEVALPPDILPPMEPATQRAPQSDSLRAILSLSEEELIALFS